MWRGSQVYISISLKRLDWSIIPSLCTFNFNNHYPYLSFWQSTCSSVSSSWLCSPFNWQLPSRLVLLKMPWEFITSIVPNIRLLLSSGTRISRNSLKAGLTNASFNILRWVFLHQWLSWIVDNNMASLQEPGQGENLAMGMKNFAGAIGAWYNEEKDYDYNNPGMQ